MFVRLIFSLLLSALPAVAQEAHQPAATAVPTAISANPAEIAAGGKLCQIHCALCHGPRGEGGKGPTLAQPVLPRAPDDAASGVFVFSL